MAKAPNHNKIFLILIQKFGWSSITFLHIHFNFTTLIHWKSIWILCPESLTINFCNILIKYFIKIHAMFIIQRRFGDITAENVVIWPHTWHLFFFLTWSLTKLASSILKSEQWCNLDIIKGMKTIHSSWHHFRFI